MSGTVVGFRLQNDSSDYNTTLAYICRDVIRVNTEKRCECTLIGCFVEFICGPFKRGFKPHCRKVAGRTYRRERRR